MKKIILCLILALLTLCGCEAEGDGVESGTNETSGTAEEDNTRQNADGSDSSLNISGDIFSKAVCSAGILAGKELFTERDLTGTAEVDSAVRLTLSDNAVTEITDEGVYILSGSARDFTVKINADNQAKIQLILDGVEITNADQPALYVESADKVFLTTTDGSENSITVTG